MPQPAMYLSHDPQISSGKLSVKVIQDCNLGFGDRDGEFESILDSQHSLLGKLWVGKKLYLLRNHPRLPSLLYMHMYKYAHTYALTHTPAHSCNIIHTYMHTHTLQAP